MIFFPAIDIKDSQCVRLLRGDMNQATVFNEDPVKQAHVFETKGAKWLHIIDLNGAFSGRSVNGTIISSILDLISIPIQVGGGIRTIESIDFWLSRGVSRVILGTIALSRPDLVREACRKFPGKIAIGIDAKNGMVATEGWSKKSDMSVFNLAKTFEDSGVSSIIHTDIARDGMMMGPNFEATLSLASKVSIPVILSGGISSLSDLGQVLKATETQKIMLGGVISGRAIYEGQLGVAEGTEMCERLSLC